MLIIAPLQIHFIGATANNKLKVIIVGTTTNTKVNTYFTAPNPTATPPTQPTTKSMILINPKRLNSDSFITLFSQLILVSITLNFIILQRSSVNRRTTMTVISKKTDFCQLKKLIAK